MLHSQTVHWKRSIEKALMNQSIIWLKAENCFNEPSSLIKSAGFILFLSGGYKAT